MTDSELAELIGQNLRRLLVDQGVDDITLLAGYPTGTSEAVSGNVYFYPVSRQQRGWQSRRDTYDAGASEHRHREVQAVASVFRVQAFGTYPTAMNTRSVGDQLQLIAMLIRSRPFVHQLNKVSTGLQGLSEIKTPFQEREPGEFVMAAHFDFTLSHTCSITQKQASIDAIELEQHRI